MIARETERKTERQRMRERERHRNGGGGGGKPDYPKKTPDSQPESALLEVKIDRFV